jgi:hypothetical protein
MQERQPEAIVVAIDHDHIGAAATKNRALSQVTTEFTAFLDSDDEFLPHHLRALEQRQRESGADVVYSIPVVPQFPEFTKTEPQYGKPFDPGVLRQRSYIQTTSLVRTRLAMEAGGFQRPPDGGNYDDWGLWLALLSWGASFEHLPEETFIWNHNGMNTSGRGDRW